ncbi:hypothetical protein GCM10009751_37530 [Myceligenerans crystallogenes]|uniref:Uncharacterized protein n=1 Tax=Myceligenerans crystallogenes TaxID=316335 RepID=A0ABN2NLF9_9MICO
MALNYRRNADGGEAALAYARASGRTFSNLIQRLSWARTEARQLLKNRSPYLNIHTEDLSDVTDRMRVIYRRVD